MSKKEKMVGVEEGWQPKRMIETGDSSVKNGHQPTKSIDRSNPPTKTVDEKKD